MTHRRLHRRLVRRQRRRWRDLRGRRQRRLREPREVNEIRERLAGKAFDVIQRGERMIFLRRGVAARAIEAEAGIAHGVWRLVAIRRLPFPNLCPVPTILRTCRILDHDRPV